MPNWKEIYEKKQRESAEIRDKYKIFPAPSSTQKEVDNQEQRIANATPTTVEKEIPDITNKSQLSDENLAGQPNMALDSAIPTKAEKKPILYDKNYIKREVDFQNLGTLKPINYDDVPAVNLPNERVDRSIMDGNFYSKKEVDRLNEEYDKRTEEVIKSAVEDAQRKEDNVNYLSSKIDLDISNVDENIDNRGGIKERLLDFVEPYTNLFKYKNQSEYDSAQEKQKELKDYYLAKSILKDAQNTINAPKKGDNFAKSFGSGALNSVTDLDFWTLGISSIVESAEIMSIIKKSANDKELTPSEEAVMNALLTRTEAEFARQGDISNWYIGGNIATESIPFMVQFAATGGIANATTKGTAALVKKGLTSFAKRELGKKVGAKKAVQLIDNAATYLAKSPIAKKAVKAVGDMTIGAAARTPLMPSTYSSVLENVTPSVVGKDNEGNYILEDGKTIAQAIGDAFVEVVSESSGGLLGAPLSKVGKLLGKTGVSKAIMNSKVGDAYKVIAGSDFGRIAGELRKGGYDGLLEELGEEHFGNLIRYAFGINSVQEFKDFYTKDNQISMLIGFLPMTIASSGSSMVARGKVYKNYNNSEKGLNDILSSQNITPEQIKAIKSQLSESKLSNIDDSILNIVNSVGGINEDGTFNENGKATAASLMEYAGAKARKDALDETSGQSLEKMDGVVSDVKINEENGIYSVDILDSKGEVLHHREIYDKVTAQSYYQNAINMYLSPDSEYKEQLEAATNEQKMQASQLINAISTTEMNADGQFEVIQGIVTNGEHAGKIAFIKSTNGNLATVAVLEDGKLRQVAIPTSYFQEEERKTANDAYQERVSVITETLSRTEVATSEMIIDDLTKEGLTQTDNYSDKKNGDEILFEGQKATIAGVVMSDAGIPIANIQLNNGEIVEDVDLSKVENPLRQIFNVGNEQVEFTANWETGAMESPYMTRGNAEEAVKNISLNNGYVASIIDVPDPNNPAQKVSKVSVQKSEKAEKTVDTDNQSKIPPKEEWPLGVTSENQITIGAYAQTSDGKTTWVDNVVVYDLNDGLVEVRSDDAEYTERFHKDDWEKFQSSLANSYQAPEVEVSPIATATQEESINPIQEIINNAPKQSNGEVDYDALLIENPEAFATLYEAEEGIEQTQEELRSVLSNIEKHIDSEEKKLENADTINKRKASKEKIRELTEKKQRIDTILDRYQNNKKNQEAKQNKTDALVKEKNTDKASEETRNIAKKFPERFAIVDLIIDERGLESNPRIKILRGIATGEYKFSWKGYPFSRGVADELGLSSSESERRNRIGILSKDGYTPEQLAEHIGEELGIEDTNSIRSEIIDILSGVNSRTSALEELEQLLLFEQKREAEPSPEEQSMYWAEIGEQKRHESENLDTFALESDLEYDDEGNPIYNYDNELLDIYYGETDKSGIYGESLQSETGDVREEDVRGGNETSIRLEENQGVAYNNTGSKESKSRTDTSGAREQTEQTEQRGLKNRPKEENSVYGSDNKIITNDKYEELKNRMKDRRNRLNIGFDPEMMFDGIQMAMFHIEAGARKFADFTTEMMGDVGEFIEPYLKAFYEGARRMPEMEHYREDMTSTVEVDAFDIGDYKKQTNDAIAENDNFATESSNINLKDKENGRILQRNSKKLSERSSSEALQGVEKRRGLGRDNTRESGQISLFDGEEQQSSGRERSVLQGNVDVLEPALVEYNVEDNDNERFNQSKKLDDNISAIETLLAILSEKREASSHEKEILSKYVGFGGIKSILLDPETDAGWEKSNMPYREKVKRIIELANEIDKITNSNDTLKNIRGSILNAHFTSSTVIRSIYSGLAKLGFHGGKILEPSAGIGNFISYMPEHIKNSSTVTAVELDTLTGLILKTIHNNADVRISGIQDAGIPDNSQDLVISNIPFGNYKVYDKSFKENKSAFLNRIHNYFFAKAIDQAREGGLIVFVTSKGVLDSSGNNAIREHINKNTEFLGAVRLPNTAFKNTANTEVVTDIIFLRKNTGEKTNSDFLSVSEVDAIHKDGSTQKVKVNNYFINHPENMLGDIEAGGLYSRNDYTVKDNGRSEHLEQVIQETLSEKQAYAPVKSAVGLQADDSTHKIDDIKEGNLSYSGEQLVRKENGKAVEISINESQEKISRYIQLRDTLMNLIYAEYINSSSEEINSLRKQLNEQYNAFVSKYGKLKTSLSKISKHDADGFNVVALEKDKGVKADIFNKRTISPIREIHSVSNIDEAIIVSLSENAKIDIERIGQLLKLPVEDVLLQGKGKIFQEPTGKFVTRDEYLSGNVKQKLKDAILAVENGFSEFEYNVNELEKIIPADIPAVQIEARLGSRWIPTQIYTDFARELLNSQQIEITYLKSTDDYVHNGRANTVEATKIHGTSRVNGADILIKAMLVNPPKVYDTIHEYGKEKRILNVEETTKANEKYEEVRSLFEDWIYKTDERRLLLSSIYNERYNTTVKRVYNGDHISVPGINNVELRPHQKDAVWMLLQNNGGIIDHLVGAGKTYVMVASTMEMRRTGVAKKPMIIALKSTIPQIVESYKSAYPMGKVLAPTESDFKKENRRKLFSQIANNEWDCIIISHENYGKIPHEEETQRLLIEEEINAINAEKESITDKQALKGMEVRLKNLEARLQKLSDIDKDQSITFEQMGIDHLMVDESQQFKNLSYVTKQRGIAGLGKPEGSKRAFNLLVGIRHLQQKHQGDKGATFLSGTPITNSIVEMYSLLKYLRPSKLKELGISSFDAWATTFASPTNDIEFTVTGDFKQKTRFREFINVPELSMLYTEIADIRTDDNLKLDKPEMESGGYTVENIQMSEDQLEYAHALMEFAKTGNGKLIGRDLSANERKAIMLISTTLSSKMAIDMRLIDPSYEYDKNGKIAKLVDNAHKLYNETSHFLGTQLIFSDLGTPKNTKNKISLLRDYMEDELGVNIDTLNEIFGDIDIAGYRTPSPSTVVTKLKEILELSDSEIREMISNSSESVGKFNIYDEIKQRLIEKGIPESQIVFIHDYNTAKKKDALFKKVRNGEIRIVLGSTQKLGTGVNIQDKVISVHHIDVPWTPAAMEQRNGRALRQGNIAAKEHFGDKVRVYAYATERTLDAYKYQLLQTKQRFLTQIKNGEIEDRVLKEGESDAESGVSYAELVALLSGNTDILLKSKLENKFNVLKRAKRNFEGALYEAVEKKKKLEDNLPVIVSNIEKTKENISSITESMQMDENGKIVIDSINGKLIEPTKDKDKVTSITYAKEATGIIEKNADSSIKYLQLGNYKIAYQKVTSNNNTIIATSIVSDNGVNYSFNFSLIPGIFANNIQKSVQNIRNILITQENVLEKTRKDIKGYSEIIEKGDNWNKQEEYNNTAKELKEVTERLKEVDKKNNSEAETVEAETSVLDDIQETNTISNISFEDDNEDNFEQLNHIEEDGKEENKSFTSNTMEYKHTKTGHIHGLVKLNFDVPRNVYLQTSDIAKKHKGKWSSFAKGFLFNDTESANRFSEEINNKGIQYQKSGEKFIPINKKKLDKIINRLNQTSLAKDIRLLNEDELIAEAEKLSGKKIPLTDKSGDVYGFVTSDGTVYLNTSKMNANTPIHEFGHIWLDFIKGNYPELYAHGVELIKQSPYWEKVNNSKAYSGLSEEQKIDEALATAIGDSGEAMTNRTFIQQFSDFLNSLWNTIKQIFKIKFSTPIHNLTLDELTDLALSQLFGGKSLVNEKNKQTVENNQNNYSNFVQNGNSESEKTGLDNRQTMGSSSISETLAEQSQVQGISRTISAANIGGNTSHVYEAEELEELEARGINPYWDYPEFRKELKNQAKENGVWLNEDYLSDKKLIHDRKAQGTSENDVYKNPDGQTLTKVNNLSYVRGSEHDRNLKSFIDRLNSHNALFPEVAYTIKGFMDNKQGFPSMVLEQAEVNAERNATQEEIDEHLTDAGFKKDGKRSWSNEHEVWTNGKYELFDARPANVLKGKDGNLYFIDTVIHSTDYLHNENTEEFNNDIRFQITESESELDSSQQEFEAAKNAYLEAMQVAKNTNTVSGIVSATVVANKAAKDVEAKEEALFLGMHEQGEKLNSLTPINKELADVNPSKWEKFVYNAQNEDDPIRRLQEKIKELGGVIDDASNVYDDKNHSFGRATVLIEKFNNNEYKAIKNAYRSIMRTGELANVRPIWKKTNKPLTNQEKINVYLQAKDIQEGKEMGLPDRGTQGFLDELGISHTEYINQFENAATKPHLNKLHEAILGATKYSLNLQRKYGLIDKETYEKFTERKFYVPERGWQERDMIGRDTYYINNKNANGSNPYNAALVKAKGRKSLASDPIAYITSIAHSTVLSAEKNRTKQVALNFVMRNLRLGRENGLFGYDRVWYVEATNDNGGPKLDANGNKIYDEVYTRPAKDLFDAGRVRSEVSNPYQIQRTQDEAQQHRVIAYVNGQKYVIWFADERVANGINRNTERKDISKVEATTKQVTRYLSSVMTQYNPAFAAWNLARDTHLALSSNWCEYGLGFTAKFMKEMGKVQPALAKYIATGNFSDKEYGKMLSEFFEDGSATGYSFLKDIDQLQRNFTKDVNISRSGQITENIIKGIPTAFSALTEYSELLVRFAQYAALRKDGKTRFQAATGAKNISVNFNRKGAMRFGTSFFAFWNATVQGTAKILNLGWNNSGKFSVLSGLLFAGGLINTLFVPDDPDEERAWGEYDRMSNIVIGNYKLPLAHGLRVIWGAGVQAALAMKNKKSIGNAILDGVSFAIQDLLPVDLFSSIEWDEESNMPTFNSSGLLDLVPTSGRPVAEVIANRTFTKAKIHPEPFLRSQDNTIPQAFLGKKDVNPMLQGFSNFMLELGGGDKNIKSLYKSSGDKVGDIFNINPSDIQHLLKGYTGGVGSFLVDIGTTVSNAIEGEFDPSTVPILNRAYKPYNSEKILSRERYSLNRKIKAYENLTNETKKSLKLANKDGNAKVAKEMQDTLDKTKQRQETYYKEAKKLMDEYKKTSEKENFNEKEFIKKFDKINKEWD